MSVAVKTLRIAPDMITPDLHIKDPLAAWWFSQAVLRLRREIAWCWQQRMPQDMLPQNGLPPTTDAAIEALDWVRYAEQKQVFFAKDTAAAYLSRLINDTPKPIAARGGYWQLLCEQLELDEPAQFVMALALAVRLDAGLAPVFATSMNDLTRPFPTLALAQRLWDVPEQMIHCADPEHILFRSGILRDMHDAKSGHLWQRPLDMGSMLAQQLIDPDAPLPPGIRLAQNIQSRELGKAAEVLVGRLRAQHQDRMQLIPLLGPKDAAFADWAAALSRKMQRQLVIVDRSLLIEPTSMASVANICRLRRLDILLPEAWTGHDRIKQHAESIMRVANVPICWYVPVSDLHDLKHLPADFLAPSFIIEPLAFADRVEFFKKHLGAQALQMSTVIEECARRFRFQEQTIARLTSVFASSSIPLTTENLITACTNEAVIEMGNLAQPVTARFSPEQLILPEAQSDQFQDIVHAMRALTIVHYRWGTAKAWNESGLSVLFCGAPGTGKTMAAEALSTALQLPMYRVDLSQVVNKYIGETEKNLKKIFDAAELSDCILFFDEADALFGKRTDVKDAHDRFANIEISYLLERMERFKGLAILATNRRKDLDEAFMRRLRYIIEFPVPGVTERRRIWEYIFPETVDVSELDFHYLAKQFQLSGGHIRSIAFNACLRAADTSSQHSTGKICMPDVLITVKRELEKMNRSVSPELFGDYRHLLKEPNA